MITQARLKELVHYDPETGVFTRNVSRTNSKAGDPVGHSNATGYLRACIDGRKYFLHKLAWLYVNGEWPPECVDHIDLDKKNNRIANLRLATNSQNQANRPITSQNKTGFKGVHWCNHFKRYVAQISKDNKVKNLGYFRSAEAAHAAYCKAAKELHGEFARAA